MVDRYTTTEAPVVDEAGALVLFDDYAALEARLTRQRDDLKKLLEGSESALTSERAAHQEALATLTAHVNRINELIDAVEAQRAIADRVVPRLPATSAEIEEIARGFVEQLGKAIRGA